MNPIDSCHLRFVGAGHYGSLHPIPVYFLFKAVQPFGNFGLFLRHARKKGIINIDQRLALHPAFNIIHTQILLSHFMPEVTVLCFRVYHHAVKIKKYGGCFCCVHKLSFT